MDLHLNLSSMTKIALNRNRTAILLFTFIIVAQSSPQQHEGFLDLVYAPVGVVTETNFEDFSALLLQVGAINICQTFYSNRDAS